MDFQVVKQFGRQLVAASAVAVVMAVAMAASTLAERPNVLFIAVDDLRPQLNCYGRSQMHSPNIDRLASEGVRFDNAFCMVPTCGASRASMLTGVRPARNRFVSYRTRAEVDAPNAVTMNTTFKNAGYHTVSLGKVFHHRDDNEDGWSEKPWRPDNSDLAGGHYDLQENRDIVANPNNPRRGPAWECADVPDATYADGRLAEKAIEDLRRLAKGDKPFFLAVGFYKPHLPFVAPKKYWDLYDRESIELPDNYRFVPEHAPPMSIHSFGELRSYYAIPKDGPVSDEQAISLIHGYYACVSYTDALIGKVLAEVDALRLRDDTIVVLWSDHGWQLGDHTMWCKHCCYETSIHIPLILRVPGKSKGAVSPALVESIDLYPTLCELCDVAAPGGDQLAGKSFVRLLEQPDAEWKREAISRFQSGDTIRTSRYRYAEYTSGNGALLGRMLYDHESDPRENVNVAGEPENEALVDDLSERLRAGMGKPSPK